MPLGLVESTETPLSGLWRPQTHLKYLLYGPSCVQNYLCSVLPSPTSRVFVLTGSSLANKTPLIKQVEAVLGNHHAGTFFGIKQHGQIAGVEQAFDVISKNDSIDTILTVGGGSPIDSAKTISLRIHEERGHFLTHIAIPTTLSAAECTAGGGFTREDGVKVGFMAPGMGVSAIFYDPHFLRFTPKKLLLSTGMRAIDHAVETMYHPNASEMPWKVNACWGLGTLLQCLVQVDAALQDSDGSQEKLDNDTLTRLMLAAFATSGMRGTNFGHGMGLSHALGHALGSPYDIPHGETSCMTLSRVVRLKAKTSHQAALQISHKLLPAIGMSPSDDPLQDAMEFARHLDQFVENLKLQPKPLGERGIGRDQIPIIVKRALRGTENSDLYEAVTELVESLF